MEQSRGYNGGTLEHRHRYLVIWHFGMSNHLLANSESYLTILLQLISLIHGGDYNLFRPHNVRKGDEEYGLEVLKQQFRYFGPFPKKYDEIASRETTENVVYLMHVIPPSEAIPFSMVNEQQICKKDKNFIGKMMMMDWRDRATAKDLLDDDWFKDNE